MILKQVQLVKPLFLGKTNLGDKLDSDSKAGMVLEFKADEQMVYVHFNDETGIIPASAVTCMVPKHEKTVSKAATSVPKHRGPVKAQVESPEGDMYTPGKGRTGQ